MFKIINLKKYLKNGLYSLRLQDFRSWNQSNRFVGLERPCLDFLEASGFRVVPELTNIDILFCYLFWLRFVVIFNAQDNTLLQQIHQRNGLMLIRLEYFLLEELPAGDVISLVRTQEHIAIAHSLIICACPEALNVNDAWNSFVLLLEVHKVTRRVNFLVDSHTFAL